MRGNDSWRGQRIGHAEFLSWWIKRPRSSPGTCGSRKRPRADCRPPNKGTRRLVRAILRTLVHTLNLLENQGFGDNCKSHV